MSRPKHTRRDANHRQLVSNCHQLGMVVYDTADIGGECPDTIICWRGKCLPVEIKFPGKSHDLTDGERAGMENCAIVGVPWVIATELDDVLRAFGALDAQPCGHPRSAIRGDVTLHCAMCEEEA